MTAGIPHPIMTGVTAQDLPTSVLMADRHLGIAAIVRTLTPTSSSSAVASPARATNSSSRCATG
jgi:hypothetical protein